MKKILIMFGVILIFQIGVSSAQTMIGNPKLKISYLTAEQTRKLYLGKIRSIDGVALKLAGCKSIHKKFLKKFIGRSAWAYKKMWTRKMFAEGTLPPTVFETDDKVINFVKGTENAIGYVSSAPKNGSVKVLLK